MPPSIVRLAFASLFLCGTSHAEESPLKVYLELTDAQAQQINRVLRPEIRPPVPGLPRRVYQYAGRPTPPTQAATSAAVLVLTEVQMTKLPALEEALRLQLARVGAISFRLIDARQELISCWCTAEDAFVESLGLTEAQRGELRGRPDNERLYVLTQEQRAKFDALRTRSPLFDAADEAARLGLITDRIPRGECLCN
jgi:hypothetical protein